MTTDPTAAAPVRHAAPSDDSSDPVQEHLHAEYHVLLEQYAADLETLADRVRSVGAGDAPRAYDAGRVVAVVNQALANLPTTRLVQAAADCEVHRARSPR